MPHLILNSLRIRSFCSSPPTKDVDYIKWLDRVKEKKKHFLMDLGIFNLIQVSRVGLKYNSHMLIASTCLWDTSTNMFHLPCGMITLTLFEIAAIIGLQPTGETFKISTKTKTNLRFTLNIVTYNSFIKDHQASTYRVYSQEHIAFLIYWISRYVFCA